ncbi:MAG: PBP1A family penicillin-binding protein [Candidatus Magnetomorum sp.]|nr:PBP1A family penicillin-binding protein [Candidatus Magnetomorum sp.]
MNPTDKTPSSQKPKLLFVSEPPVASSQSVSLAEPSVASNQSVSLAELPDDIIAEDASRDIPLPEYEPPPMPPEKSAPPDEEPPKKKKSMVRSLIKGVLLWSILIFALLVLGLAGFLYILNRNIPDFTSLKNYHPPVTTQVLDDHKNVIAEFFQERRFVKPLNLIPKRLKQAFISAEDSRFYDHQGYDFRSIVRSFIKNVIAGRVRQGGSTITQQTARSFLISRHKTYLRKIQELILAYQLEQAFSKEHILFLYLNQIYLGYGAYGVEAAAQNYFGKSINQLSLAECAALAGLPQAPARYAPDNNYNAFKARQKYVLKRMYNEGYITDTMARKAFNESLNIHPRRNRFAENAPYFSEYVRILLEEQLGTVPLYQEGLTIYTSLNMQMQSAAQNALEKGLSAIEKRQKYPKDQPPLQGALICIDIQTGQVKAMVGGRDFSESKFNRTTQAIRQPGSAFKPIIYSAALDSGFTPASVIIDSPVVVEDKDRDFIWKPHNYENTFYGPTTLRKAMALSRNLVTIKLLQKVGIETVIDYAKNLGISSPIQKDLSIALGSSGVSLMELVRAYAVFASSGYLIEPVCVVKIEDNQKKDVPLPVKPEKKQVIEASTAYCITHILKGVVQQGTAQQVKVLNRPVAGKTGSTNNLYDAWFVGYTPRYITGVWVGFDQPHSIGEKETGARAAIPIWLSFMESILTGKPVRKFSIPSGVVFSKIDADTGCLATPGTKNPLYECFKEGTSPNPPKNTLENNISQDSFFKKNF